MFIGGGDPIDPCYTCGTVKHPDYLMVWSCFSYSGIGVVLHRDQCMNQCNYLELLCENLLDSFQKCGNKIFMQDGAPCHTASYAVQWLSDYQVPFFNNWPANSPELIVHY